MREIAEETGLQGDVLRHLATIEYWFRAGPTRIHKYVDFFLVRYPGGVLVPQQAEVDAAHWVPLADALAVASFDRERRFSTWLLSIGSNYCIDRLRRRRFAWVTLDDAAFSLPTKEPGPERSALSHEQREIIQRALQKLVAGQPR